ncbi:MAG: DUF4157 domain-containing protein [Balneolaceae bacterium]|nr:DUF4157 domain-containing protein [Balneolaceae bacterium]
MKSTAHTDQTKSPSKNVGSKSSSFFKSVKSDDQPFFGPAVLQSKLEIGEPDDPYERQADWVADAVVQMPDASQPVQRQEMEEEEELQMKREPILQRKCEVCKEEENIQRKSNNSAQSGHMVSQDVSTQLQAKSGKGNQLPRSVQSEMSQKIGANFNGVNIHTDSDASQMSTSIGARAFTHGNDIYFNSGEYNPSTHEGKHLLAHELTHVVQQGKAKKRIQREPLSDTQRDNYVTNIIAEMGTTHTDYNNGAQDADRAISAAAQANADLAKALFSISMAIIVPGFGGVISSFATRVGITLTTSVADRIGGVIGEAAKIAGENEINEAFQSTE